MEVLAASFPNCNGRKTFQRNLYTELTDNRYFHITPLLTELHWLNNKQRIDFKVFFLLRTKPFMAQLQVISVI